MSEQNDPLKDIRMNEAEREIVHFLAGAWNSFVALGPHHPYDAAQFQDAINAAQSVIACRVAKRVDPKWWR